MNFINIFPMYLSWHYSKSLRGYFTIWGRMFWFVTFFYSFKEILKTFFEPFSRASEKYKRGFNLSDFAGTLVVNLSMRLVGAFIRSFIMLLGLLSYVVLGIFGLIGFILWAILPLVLLSLVVLAGYILITNIPILK